MQSAINIYCDESCHLENDHQTVMVLGAVACPLDRVENATRKAKELRERHHLSRHLEIKWGKVSRSKLDFFMDVINFFFDNHDLSFRGLVIKDKTRLAHKDHSQTHDDFYYKMYYQLLRVPVLSNANLNVYIDIKDTQGALKVKGLTNYLKATTRNLDTERSVKIQQVRSNEAGLLQLTDLLIGSLSYLNRNLDNNPAKLAIINQIRERSGLTLKCTTSPGRNKFDLFFWEGRNKST